MAERVRKLGCCELPLFDRNWQSFGEIRVVEMFCILSEPDNYEGRRLSCPSPTAKWWGYVFLMPPPGNC
jgi:hypothetical protein